MPGGARHSVAMSPRQTCARSASGTCSVRPPLSSVAMSSSRPRSTAVTALSPSSEGNSV